MMRFFLDTEFIEDGERIHPLAVAVVDECGDAFYAVITDVDRALAGDWVRANVLPYLDERPADAYCVTGTRAEVAEAIRQWVADRTDAPEFWADYGAYDWVLLCQLYGTMLDLPDGWPMFVRDIQQIRPDGMELPDPEHEHQAVSDARNCRDRWRILTGAVR